MQCPQHTRIHDSFSELEHLLRHTCALVWAAFEWSSNFTQKQYTSTDCRWTAQVAACADPEAAAQLLQAAARPMEDRLRGWGDAAAAQYGADGATDAWDSDMSDEETPQQKDMRACPACCACDRRKLRGHARMLMALSGMAAGCLSYFRALRMQLEQLMPVTILCKPQQRSNVVGARRCTRMCQSSRTWPTCGR